MAKRKKKKPKIDFAKLSEAQVVFIHTRVKLLGSVEEVGRVYDKNCTVDAFAKNCAKMMFGGVK